MKRETISQALNLLDERHISDTAVFAPAFVQESPERMSSMNAKKKHTPRQIVSIALAAALAFGIVLAILGWVPLLGTILRVARFAALALVTVCAFLNAYRTWQGQPDQLPYIGGITIIK